MRDAPPSYICTGFMCGAKARWETIRPDKAGEVRHWCDKHLAEKIGKYPMLVKRKQ